MKQFCLIYLLLFPTILLAQHANENNVFLTYEEFVKDAPSVMADFTLKKWTKSEIFLYGRIDNYKIVNDKENEMLVYEAWGVKADGKVYVNAYPFSELLGYNEVLEKGYYTYFIGQPGFAKAVQRETGITRSDGQRKKVLGKVGYVMLPNGSVKVLDPKYLELLVADDRSSMELMPGSLHQENVLEMFNCLSNYNKMKRRKKVVNE